MFRHRIQYAVVAVVLSKEMSFWPTGSSAEERRNRGTLVCYVFTSSTVYLSGSIISTGFMGRTALYGPPMTTVVSFYPFFLSTWLTHFPALFESGHKVKEIHLEIFMFLSGVGREIIT